MKRYKVPVLLIVIPGMLLAACTAGAPAQDSTQAATPPPAFTALPTQIQPTAVVESNSSALAVQNATYLIDGQPVTLVNGVAETELAPGSASKQVTRYFGNAVELDVNGDGVLDSAFLLQQEAGGSGTFYYVVVALQTENGYIGTNAIFLGDRIAPQSTTADLNDPAQFVVSYADRNPGEPMSTPPSLVVSKTFKLENDTLVEVVASP